MDPAVWGITEGKTEKGTDNVIEELPGLIQVVGSEGNVVPPEGKRMLKIDAWLYVKANIRQYYPEPISKGKLTQIINFYPAGEKEGKYLQQVEIDPE